MVECLILDFGSDHDPKVIGLSLVLGSTQSMQPAEDSPHPCHLCSFSLKINKQINLKKKRILGIYELKQKISAFKKS